jgi:hypothetical protein
MSVATFHPPAFFEPLQVESPAEQGHPSFVLARHLWNRVQDDAERIEKLFVAVYEKLYTLKQWERRGYVRPGEIDQSKEWYDLRRRALGWLFVRNGVMEDYFTDGAGI